MGGSAWQRASRWLRWKPGTYRQVWLFSVPGFGVPGFVIMSVLGQHQYRFAEAIIYSAVVTLVGGLGQSYQLRRRRQRQADLAALRAAEVWRPYGQR